MINGSYLFARQGISLLGITRLKRSVVRIGRRYRRSDDNKDTQTYDQKLHIFASLKLFGSENNQFEFLNPLKRESGF